MALTMQQALDGICAQMAAIKAKNDAAYAAAAPFESELDRVNAEAAALNERALALAAKIEAAWGADHIERKRSYAALAQDRTNLIRAMRTAGETPNLAAVRAS